MKEDKDMRNMTAEPLENQAQDTVEDNSGIAPESPESPDTEDSDQKLDLSSFQNGGEIKKKGGLKRTCVRLWFTVQMAFHGIISNPLRSCLTLLGVAIGVASVVSLMSIGEGARKSVMDQFNSLGANVIIVEATNSQYYFNPTRADEFVNRVDSIIAATPVVDGKADIKWRRIKGSVEVLGVNSAFPQVRDHPLQVGHFFSELHVEQRAQVAVLGYNLALTLNQGRNLVGQTITVNGLDYRILGVLAEKGEDNGDGIDNKIIIPYTSAQKITKKTTVSEIWCKADSMDTVDLAIVQLGRIFRYDIEGGGSSSGGGAEGAPEADAGADMGMDMPAEEYLGEEPGAENPEEESSTSNSLFEESPITVTSLNRMVEEADRANRVMTLMLGAIAAVSLLVGGLGIMNIMLVAVTERTGEIGVRRALGARQGDLISQFILEALYLSGIGAFLGVIIGLSLLNVFNSYGLSAIVSFEAIRVSVVVALGCGLIFGVYPAISASSVPPVEALRRN